MVTCLALQTEKGISQILGGAVLHHLSITWDLNIYPNGIGTQMFEASGMNCL
ncbi:hypothetical protein [Paenibacillus baimaensis]|uniref:hypothetical protein n=1 Tax=Paenibacillus baimaensis TaxID=2982185 RepID=UPI0021D01DD7|nr:hypothetical protein [Paenibacillus sp. WQ 127069]